MSDLKNKYGEFVYRIEGDHINDTYGNWLYTVVGDHINDSHGNWLYTIVNEDLFDTHGNKIGAMEDFADIVPLPKNAESSTTSISGKRPNGYMPVGCFGWAISIIFFLFTPFYVNIRYFKEDANRKEWWGTLCKMFLLLFVMAFLTGGDAVLPGSIMDYVLPMVFILLILVSIRRIRDTGKPWWWVLIPGVNLVMCAFFPGK